MIFKGKITRNVDLGEGMFFVCFDGEKQASITEPRSYFPFDLTLNTEDAKQFPIGTEVEVEIRVRE
jgi:hypothetical protein